jgi:hypothetical protein
MTRRTLKTARPMYHFAPSSPDGRVYTNYGENKTIIAGKTVTTWRTPVLCSAGYHASPTVADAIAYAAGLHLTAPALTLVRLFGQVDEACTTKHAADHRRCTRIIDAETTQEALNTITARVSADIAAKYDLPAQDLDQLDAFMDDATNQIRDLDARLSFELKALEGKCYARDGADFNTIYRELNYAHAHMIARYNHAHALQTALLEVEPMRRAARMLRIYHDQHGLLETEKLTRAAFHLEPTE